MTELSLFTGSGGGVLGSKLLGWRTIGYVEYEKYCQKILKQRISDGILDAAPIFGDIRSLTKEKVDFAVNYSYRSFKSKEDDMAAHRKNYDEAVRLYSDGLSIQNVADFYGVSRQAMHDILRRRCVDFRQQKRYGEDNHFFRGGISASGRAQNLLERALEKGLVQRKTHCEKCGDHGTFKDGRSKIQGHHSDYNKPLDVKWFCQKCHHEWHKNNKAKKLEEDTLESTDGYIDVVTAGFP